MRDAGVKTWSLGATGVVLTCAFLSVSLTEEGGSACEGGRHAVHGQGCRTGTGRDWAPLSGKLDEAPGQLPGRRRGVATKADTGGVLSADLPSSCSDSYAAWLVVKHVRF